MIGRLARLWRLAIGKPQLGDTAEGRAVADAMRTVRDYEREIAEVQQERADALREGDSEAVEEADDSIRLGYEMLEYQKEQTARAMAEYRRRRGVLQ